MKTNTNKYHYILGVCAIIVLACLFFAFRSSHPTSAEATTVQKIYTDIAKGALLIDVSSREEFADRHARGAINLPLEELERGGLLDAQRTKAVYIQSYSGVENEIALQKLKNAGYLHVSSLGSVEDWQRLGGDTIYK